MSPLKYMQNLSISHYPVYYNTGPSHHHLSLGLLGHWNHLHWSPMQQPEWPFQAQVPLQLSAFPELPISFRIKYQSPYYGPESSMESGPCYFPNLTSYNSPCLSFWPHWFPCSSSKPQAHSHIRATVLAVPISEMPFPVIHTPIALTFFMSLLKCPLIGKAFLDSNYANSPQSLFTALPCFIFLYSSADI